MDISKENIYNVKYTSVIERGTLKKKRWTSKIKQFIRENRIISIATILFIMCVGMNLTLIYNFMKILQEVA